MTAPTLEQLLRSHDYGRRLQSGLTVAIKLNASEDRTVATLTAPGVTHSLISVFPADDLYVSFSATSSEFLLPTLWLGSLSIDVTREEAAELLLFIGDEAKK